VIYRRRVSRIAAGINARFDERLAERTRIAQELHDTLLQGFLSASMQVHVGTDCLPTDSAARPILTRALQLMVSFRQACVTGARDDQSCKVPLLQLAPLTVFSPAL
jgi:signal transduction histidine kinase